MQRPTFEEIIKKFDSFLTKNKLSQEKIWVKAPHVHLVDPSDGDNRGIGVLHLFLPPKPVMLQAIKIIYDNAWIAPEVPFVFYVIATHDNKTICGILGDQPTLNGNPTTIEMHNNGSLIFGCNDIWNTHTLIQNREDWKKIKMKPERSSNLDYLFQ